MQVFIPHPTPYDCALAMLKVMRSMNIQIIECRQLLQAIDGTSKAWANHPITKMYKDYRGWLSCYMLCLKHMKENDTKRARQWSDMAQMSAPDFLTDELCNQHKRRLFTKSPERYPEFARYGTSLENWYVVDGVVVKYVGGKKIQ